MPELPEVETVVRGIAPAISHKTFREAILRRPDLRIPFPPKFKESIEGRTIKNVERRAKYILMHLDNETTLITHLGMSGRLVLKTSIPEAYSKHDHVILNLSDDSVLILNDARRFGLMTLEKTAKLHKSRLFAHLGAEPLSDEFTAESLLLNIKTKTSPIKTALMDQRVVVGVGNIYASESLFRSGINPKQQARKVSIKKIKNLIPNIKDVLEEAIESGGSTLRDYVKSSGESGYFQHKFQVYGRENEPCLKCTAPIKRIVQQGRSTFYCSSCQKT